MAFLIVPLVTDTTPKPQTRPKYFGTPGTQADIVLTGTAGVTWAGNYLGADAYIVWANTSGAQDTALAAQSDVIVVPALDTTITAGALATVKAKLEALGIPAQWVVAGMSYRTVLHVVLGMIALLKRMSSLLGQRVSLTGNLDRLWSSFSTATTTAFATAADEQGLDRSAIVESMTLREVLRTIGQQFTGKVVTLGQGVI